MDWTVIELDESIGKIVGFINWAASDQTALNQDLKGKAQVVVAGYPAVRPHALAVDFNCGKPTYIAASKLLVQPCATMKGDSGAPILLLKDGAATLIAVHSGSMVSDEGRVMPVSVPVSAFQNVLHDLRTRPKAPNGAQ